MRVAYCVLREGSQSRRLFAFSTIFLLSILFTACGSATPTPFSDSTNTVLDSVTAVSPQLSPSTTPANGPLIVQPAYPPPPTQAVQISEYPSPGESPAPPATSYPAPPAPTPSSPPPLITPAPAQSNHYTYLPFIIRQTESASTSTLAIAPLDFEQIRADLNAQGQEIVYAKIGFHAGIGYQSENLVEWMKALDAAGVPFFLKSTDNAEPIYIAQELKRQSGVPHTLVFRQVTNDEYDLDVPQYDLPPEEAAVLHWQKHMEQFPPELDPSLIWVETINEIDRNRAEWLGQFALKTAELAMADGFNWAAFGWAAGEPEPEHWQTPSMLAFLQLAGNNPDRLAIAVHEYSYNSEDIHDGAPYKIGRFEQLLQIADQNNLPRPTILITEWGWEYDNVPPPEQALRDIAWANQIYAPYPQVKGAAIWYLGGGFSDIAKQTEQLIIPVTEYTLQNYFTRPFE